MVCGSNSLVYFFPILTIRKLGSRICKQNQDGWMLIYVLCLSKYWYKKGRQERGENHSEVTYM